MKSNSTFEPFWKIGIFTILSLMVFIGGIGLYCHWKSSGIDDENGYNSINAVISFLTLIFTIVASFFAYSAFENTKKEFKKNKEDEEYNRAIDLLYKQLEFSKLHLSDNVYSELYQKLYLNLIYENYDLNKEILEDKNTFWRLDLDILFDKLEEEIIPYKAIILENNRLTYERKKMLGKIFALNFNKGFESTITKFIGLSKRFVNEKSFILLNNEKGQEYRLRNLAIAEDIKRIIQGGEESNK